MRTIGGLVLVAALVSAGLAMWSTSKLLAKHSVPAHQSVSEASVPHPQISAYEILKNARKDLPVQPADESAI